MKMKYLFVLTLVFLMSSFAFAQSPAGKWSGEMPGGRGGTTPVAFEFATGDGKTLTGTITVGAGMPTAITAGTIMGDTITFQAPAGGGGGGRGGGGGGAPGAGAPPAGGAPPAAGGGGGGGQGGGGGRGGGGGLATYTGKVSADAIAFSRVGGGGGGRGGGGGGAPGGGAPPDAGAAPAAPAPVTFTVKKG